ncbi:Crp/Fnr family transcriptional regulator [Zoogloea sp.]|uniref:Crp/Fnr family transcriptional regulator n=1 Tax=Zoogloea sp. TaxID=49181 RepID=UPI00261D8042|nr:Crp/Fnr family transcriptional regulator [Zoogloea sp.]MDD3354019.1 Crp/Fnr family transcriptional regulator [Zoogloea sp.]
MSRSEWIYRVAEEGHAWRIVSGTVRLDCPNASGNGFGGLAIPGDIIGAETLMFARYSFAAYALVPCILAPWPEGCETPASESLLKTLLRTEQRTAETLALRHGSSIDRVRRLLRLLASPAKHLAGATVSLPALRDTAEITCLTMETISRAMAKLRQQGEIDRLKRDVVLLCPTAGQGVA